MTPEEISARLAKILRRMGGLNTCPHFIPSVHTDHGYGMWSISLPKHPDPCPRCDREDA